MTGGARDDAARLDGQELEALIADAIFDSFDLDWSHRPASPTGRHIVDTSMESGPNNCFHCERPMK